MTRTSEMATTGRSRSRLVRYPSNRYALPALSTTAAVAAMVVLATQIDEAMLDYGVGIVPVVVPWLTAVLSVAVAAVGLTKRRAASAIGSLLIGALVILAAWAITMLPFDLLRIVGLVPLPLSGWGLVLRLLLLVAATSALAPALRVRQAAQARCTACGRVLPGTLDRLPHWPVVVAVAASLVYPVLRTTWALGGTFGTTGEPLDLDPAIAWGVVVIGSMLVAFAILLLVGRGPRWARALFGLGGILAGLALTVLGGLGAVAALRTLVTEGLQSSTSDGLLTSVFVVVYGSWFVAGLGIIVGSWRFWAHRRDDCPGCRALLAE